MQQGRQGLTERYPWLVAFAFGLFHGLGFAGALSEIGLPQDAIPLALVMFNVGVECGQIIFILAVLLVGLILKQLPFLLIRLSPKLLPYGIGSIAAFWTIERVISFFPVVA